MVTLDSFPVPNRQVQGRQLDNEAVLVLPDKGQVKVLNEVGAAIWALMDGTRTVRQIAAQIAAEYGQPPAVVEADALDFARELVAKGVITSRSA